MGATIVRRLGVTIPLATIALLVSIAIGLPLGLYAAIYRNRAIGLLSSVHGQIGIAVPTFWSRLLLSTFVAVCVGWLPPGGVGPWGGAGVGAGGGVAAPADVTTDWSHGGSNGASTLRSTAGVWTGCSIEGGIL